jgi:asparagine synthase (glutamine-hydrolysing)
MCGISGWLSLTSELPRRELLGAMLRAIDHRGPDERGVFHHHQIALGMTRLSINDLEGGRQPYFSEDRRVVAVFNGEIYNFRELRAELEEQGHRFRSRTDGEVIVHLWEEYGVEFVHRLNGMFAIALWDGESLYLFRDRLGIKPLYYTKLDGVLYFASELKSLIEIPGFSRSLNHRALRSYLTLEYVPSPHSIYRDSQKLCPAHYLKVGPTEVFIPKRYWTVPRFSADGEGTLEGWGERLRSELKASVKRRLVSDVPLGVFLSGGLDSSSLTALMTELEPGNVKSFSVGFSEKTFDESSYSRMVADRLGTEHYEQVLDSATTLAVIEPLYERLDEPLADAAIIPTFLLSKFARTEVTVALAGEGADELLGGYPTYFAHQMAEPLTALPSSLHDLLRWMVNHLPTSRKYLSFDFKLKRFCSGLGQQAIQRHLTWMGSIPQQQSESFLQNPSEPAFSWVGTPDLGLVERIQELDFGTYLAEDLLVKLDRATMLTSLEGRVPFLDHTFVESMAALPTRYKFQLLNAKRALKEAMKSSLPEPVLGRPKKGFGIPLADWLRGPLRSLLDEHLRPEYLAAQGIFNPAPVARLVAQHLEGKADHRKQLWTLIVFQKWWQTYKPVL